MFVLAPRRLRFPANAFSLRLRLQANHSRYSKRFQRQKNEEICKNSF
jgi:hypothetical protein